MGTGMWVVTVEVKITEMDRGTVDAVLNAFGDGLMDIRFDRDENRVRLELKVGATNEAVARRRAVSLVSQAFYRQIGRVIGVSVVDTVPAVDFVHHRLANGGEWVDLKRLTDGRVMCALCFGYTAYEDLNPLPDGSVEDVCKSCAFEEQRLLVRSREPGEPDALEAIGGALKRALEEGAARTADSPRRQRMLDRVRAAVPPGSIADGVEA